MSVRLRLVLPPALAVLLAACALSPFAEAAAFYTVEGFEDDVDLIVAPNREFLVVPTENEPGTSAFLKIFDLDPVTGNVVCPCPASNIAVLGWENGVDPIVVSVLGTQVLVAPTENEAGTLAEVKVMRVNANGTIAGGIVTIGLGDLGFEDGVDPVPTEYGEQGVVIPLEKENGTTAGLMALTVDPAPANFGRCTVVASDVRNTGCENDIRDTSGLLRGFVDSLDGVAYTLGDRARFAIPVQREDGSGSDVVFFDWDFTIPAPAPPPFYFDPPFSVKDHNQTGTRALPFPGFEREVDIAHLAACLPGGHPILVPVEDRSGAAGDLYLIDGTTGLVIWKYSFDGGATAPPIIGYEEGVDVVPWCNLAAPPNDLVAVPVESACGADADLLIVDLATGLFQASLEGRNPPLRVLGFEKGVEPLLWTDGALLVPVDDERGRANLLSVDRLATVIDSVEDRFANPSNVILGYERSVDPLVMPLPSPDRTLYVPVEKQDGSDANLMIFTTPPAFAVATRRNFEALNAVVVSGYERDVDPKRVAQSDGYLYVAEENREGTAARLRVHGFPTAAQVMLALPTERDVTPTAPNLYFVSTAGAMLQQNPDVYGYELGLDPTSPAGDTSTWDPPSTSSPPLGLDAGGDNTLTMRNSYFGDLDGDGRGDATDCSPREGGALAPPGEVTNLLLSRGTPSGTASLQWASQDSAVGRDTCYDVATGVSSELSSDQDYSRVSCLADGLADSPYSDGRVPDPGEGYYYLVRGQNICGVGTWGDSNITPDPRDSLDGSLDPCP